MSTSRIECVVRSPRILKAQSIKLCYPKDVWDYFFEVESKFVLTLSSLSGSIDFCLIFGKSRGGQSPEGKEKVNEVERLSTFTKSLTGM